MGKITENQIRQYVRKILLEQDKKEEEEAADDEERVVFDPEEVDLPIPKKLMRVLDPDITPQKFAQFDAELDASGKPKEQAFASAAFALTYADNDFKQAKDILKLAIRMLPKLEKGMEKAAEKAEGKDEEEGEATEELDTGSDANAAEAGLKAALG